MVLDLCIMLESVGVANRPYPMTKILEHNTFRKYASGPPVDLIAHQAKLLVLATTARPRLCLGLVYCQAQVLGLALFVRLTH